MRRFLISFLIILAVVLLTLTAFSCKAKQPQDMDQTTDVAPTDTVYKETVVIMDIKPEVEKASDWDIFLDLYEKTITLWEQKAASGKLTESEIAELNKQKLILTYKAEDQNFKKKGTPVHLQRWADLNKRMIVLVKY